MESGEEVRRRNPAKKSGKVGKRSQTIEREKKITEYLAKNESATTAELAGYIGLGVSRTREILSAMDNIEAEGATTSRVYKLSSSETNIDEEQKP